MVKTPSTLDVEAFIARYPRRMQQLILALRRIIRKSVPGVLEAVNSRQNLITYRVPDEAGTKSHYFCHIAPFDDHLRLGFEHGAQLADPAHLLTGRGKRTRHILVSKSSDIPPEEVGMMAAEAALVAVNHGHAIV